jgi:hypothetical protein
MAGLLRNTGMRTADSGAPTTKPTGGYGMGGGVQPVQWGPTSGGSGTGGVVSVTGGGSSSGGTINGVPQAPPVPAVTPPPDMNLNAEMSPELMALLGEAKTNITDLKNGTGTLEQDTAANVRDAREGARNQMRESSLVRGVASGNALASYDADTLGAEEGAISDVAARRRDQVSGAISSAAAIAKTPLEIAMQEKALALNAYSAQQAAQAQAYNQWLSLVQTQRQSPINNAAVSGPAAGGGGAYGGGYSAPVVAGSSGASLFRPTGSAPSPGRGSSRF